MTSISNEDLVAIEQFRNRVKDILVTEEHHSNHYLVRWLRARDYDLEKAEEMLRKNMIWREENKLDEILEKQIDSFYAQNYPYYFEGYDKNGHAVGQASVGKWNIKQITNARRKEFFDYTNQALETLLEGIRNSDVLKKDPKNSVPQAILIVDWTGLSFSQLFSIQAVQELFSVCNRYEAYYPEILHKAFFINCPSLFTYLFAMFQQFLAPKTLNKISVYGTKRDEWENDILQTVDESQLHPKFWAECLRNAR